eukprot:Seg3303.2 transcript_id=Seg3303.2/GoldUCD/mRNA.D3Y31 product="putative methyltransferase MJ1487" protein_id=Seg3303.2/GoldUCD/D3Y31
MLRCNARSLLMVSLDWCRPKDPPLSLGTASIISHVEKYGIHVKEISHAVNKPNFNIDNVIAQIKRTLSQNPVMDCGIGAYVWNDKHVCTIIKALREDEYPGRIIIGGPQVSYTSPSDGQRLEDFYPGASAFVRGYGEVPMAKLMTSSSETPAIKGVHWANEPDMGLSASIDLEKLPSPYLTGHIKPQRFLRWETQRGCPFRCSFCQHRESNNTTERKRQYFDQHARIQKEIDWICKHTVIQDLAVLDPTFNSGPNYINIIDSLHDGGYTGKLALQCRMEMVKPEFLDAVERLNEHAFVSLEFGLQTIHKNEQKLIQRPNNLRKAAWVLEQCKLRKIDYEISLIFGLPGQTVESFKESIAWCLDQGAETIMAFPLMLLRGTPLHANKGKLGLVESNEISHPDIPRVQEDITHVVSSPSFTYDDWKRMSTIAADMLNSRSMRGQGSADTRIRL